MSDLTQENELDTKSSGNDEVSFDTSFQKSSVANMIGIIFLVIGTSLILGIFYSFWFKNQVSVIDAPVIVPAGNKVVTDKTSEDWMVYENYDHYFSLKYPATWKYEISTSKYDTDISMEFYPVIENDPTPLYTFLLKVYSQEKGAAAMITEPLSETNYYSIQGEKIYRFTMVPSSEELVTPEIEKVYMEIFSQILKSFKRLPKEEEKTDCVVTGCSGQLCAEESTTTTCEYREIYSCYKAAICERQKSGECGWTMTEDLKTCLREASRAEKPAGGTFE